MPIQRSQTPEGIQLSVPASYYRTRGGIMAAAGLALGSLCCCTGGVGAMDSGEVEPLILLFALGLVLGVLLPLIGASVVFRAQSLARTVLITPTQFVFPEGAVDRSEIVELELSTRLSHGPLLKQWPAAVAVARSGQAYALSGPLHVTLDGRTAAALLTSLGSDLGMPCHDRRPNPFEMKPWLCYFPIAGVFLFASVGTLIFSRDASKRFAAKQSLLHLGLTMCVAVVFGAIIAASFGVVAAFGVHPALVVIPVLLWAVIHMVLNLVLRLYASYQASKDPMWVAPWLRPISGKWAGRAEQTAPTQF